jgi:hypothetical protein
MSVPAGAEHVLSLDPVAAGQLDQAASFVVGLLADPGSDIRVHEGQLGLADVVVVAGHPDGFALEPLSPVDPGTVWAVDGYEFSGGRTVPSPPSALRVRFWATADPLLTPSRCGRPRLRTAAEAPRIAGALKAVEPTRPVDSSASGRAGGKPREQADAGDLVLLAWGPMVPPVPGSPTR